jgi:hypothetical protein
MPNACLKGIKTPEEQIAELAAKVASLEAQLAIQKGIVEALLKRLYGAKSEKMSHDQLLMTFLEEEEKSPTPPLEPPFHWPLNLLQQRPAPSAPTNSAPLSKACLPSYARSFILKCSPLRTAFVC